MEQGLYLLTPAGTDGKELIARFERFCEKTLPDALLFNPAGYDKEFSRRFIQTVQEKDVACIIENDMELALETVADGVQIDYSPDIKKIRKQTAGISLGVICATRDEAMRAGEAGADYIGFDNENAAPLTQWWSELFTVPCISFNPAQPCAAADFKIAFLNG